MRLPRLLARGKAPMMDRPMLQTPRWFPLPPTVIAAGSELVITPNTQGGWLIKSLRFSFATSAAVGNRTTRLVADDGTGIWWEDFTGAAQAPSLTTSYSAYDGGVPGTRASGLVVTSWPRVGLWLPQGNRLRTITTGLDVADQYAAVSGLIYELPSGPWVRMEPTELVYIEPLAYE